MTKGQARARRGALALALCLALFGPTLAHAQEGPVDLLGQYDIRMGGPGEFANAGVSVDGAGDVNNDGTNDVIVGAYGADVEEDAGEGRAFVVFGTPSPGAFTLASATEGFAIDGADEEDSTGAAVAGVGDVNNDGLDDVAVAASDADENARALSGSVYVVFGKSNTTTVDLAALGAGGFRIDGAASLDRLGIDGALDGAGDVNNDDLDDIVIGARNADNNTRTDSGSSYVVFGKASGTTVDLASLGAQGYRIDGAAANDSSGYDVAGGFDVDDDNIPDVIIGSGRVDNNTRTNSGSAYVVFGKATTTTVDLGSLGAAGYRIDGSVAGEGVGDDVGMARNIDGDGKAELIIGAPDADHGGEDSGSTYVVFARALRPRWTSRRSEPRGSALMARPVRKPGSRWGPRET